MTAAVDDLFRGLVVPPPGEWIQEALCAQTDLDAFHPVKGGSGKEAKQVCARCPVQRPCLRWAVQNGERAGIFGGLAPKERRGLTVEAVDARPPVVLLDEPIPAGRPLPLAVVPNVRPRPIPEPRPVPEEQEPVAPVKKARARVAACGTTGGYARHKKSKEPPCGACRAAAAEYQREWYQRKQQQKPADSSGLYVPSKSVAPENPPPRTGEKPVVRVMWLLPPTPTITRTEYAIEDGAGALVPVHPHAAVELAAAGERIHCRHVTDWAPIGGPS